MKIFMISLALAVTLQTMAEAQDRKSKEMTKDNVALKVGDQAPDWKMTGSDGKVYRLSDYKDKQGVVVAWYPAALTGG